MVSGVALFRLNRAEKSFALEGTGEQTLGPCAERYVDKHCLAFRQADLASEVTDEDEKVR